LTLKGATAVSTVLATVCAILSIYSVSLSPPGLHARHLQMATASAHVLVDAPRSWIVNQNATEADFQSLSRRADLMGELLASGPLRDAVGRRIGVPGDRIAMVSRITGNVMATLREPDSEARANQILLSRLVYRVDIQAEPNRPVLNLYTQAPTVAEAKALADASIAELVSYLDGQAIERGYDLRRQVHLTELGQARGAVINAGTTPQIALLTWLVVFCGTLGLLAIAMRAHRGWRQAGADEAGLSPRPQEPVTERLPDDGIDLWPHTTRVLPWSIAGFMAILWLMPFNTTQLSASLPFDLKFDRLVLPFIMGLWILTLAANRRGAPRVRPTWIHAGIFLFVLVVSVGIVLDARYLDQTMEFDLASKKLSLLISYALLFAIVASVIRPREVPAFFKYNLILAVLCALGTIVEYRWHYNVFYDMTDRLLPGFFTVGKAESNAVDDLGRVLTRGPGEHPLETVAMLSMALPIALVGIMQSKRRRDQVLYGLAACIIMAAAISTYRKSALMAPASVCLTLAYFRRRELLRLAPLAVVSLVVIHALSPGAFGSILFQLHPNRLGVGTVSDRTADYDAVRPDVWSHLLFGRGYGSYDHVSYRILDSEMLARLVDSGVLGVLTYVLMLLSIIAMARRLIHLRHPLYSGPALAVAAAAVAFFVVSFLFDVSSFPHTPYILLSLAGLLAVLVAHPEETGTLTPDLMAQREDARRRARLRARPMPPRPDGQPEREPDPEPTLAGRS
jgi:hypothetical protein